MQATPMQQVTQAAMQERGIGGTNEGACDGERQQTGSPLKSGTRVILAEDDDLRRNRMQRILSDQGFEVISVADGFELICRIPEWRPDMLLASATLPRLTGPQVCALLHQCPDYRDLPVFILKHEESRSEHQSVELENCGADGVLSSPFSSEELSSLLDTRVAV